MEEKKEVKIPLVKMSGSAYKIVIPEEVEKKIRYACKEVWSTEWSGTLFFTYEGNFEDDNLVITCKDIFIMDIGSATYTEFDMSPDVIAYMAQNPELLDCQMGLIHSHNNMATFFSGTDQETLREEGKDRNNFVSLIVNNAGTYTAAITRKIVTKEIIHDNSSTEFFGEGTIEFEEETEEFETESIEWFDLKVIKEGETLMFQDMADRFNEIREAKKKVIVPATPVSTVKKLPTTYWGDEETRFGKVETDKVYPGKTSAVVEEATLFDDLPGEPLGPSDEFSTDLAGTICMDLPFDKVKFNVDKVRSAVKQIVTGSIVLPNDSKLDLNKWCNSMTDVYRKRFGYDMSANSAFDCWAESIIEYIIWNTEDYALKARGYNMDEVAAFLAYGIISELTDLPSNIYIKAFVKKLKKYIEL